MNNVPVPTIEQLSDHKLIDLYYTTNSESFADKLWTELVKRNMVENDLT